MDYWKSYLILAFPNTYSTSGACSYTINYIQSDICQLRWDIFLFLNLCGWHVNRKDVTKWRNDEFWNFHATYSNVMVAYRARLALAAVKAMSQNLRGNRVRPKSNNGFFHPDNISETLLAWRIRNNGGDSWSHENLDFDLHQLASHRGSYGHS